MDIEHLAIFDQSLKSMSEPFRDKQGQTILRTECRRIPMEECWRTLAHVDRNVKNTPTQARYEFKLCIRG